MRILAIILVNVLQSMFVGLEFRASYPLTLIVLHANPMNAFYSIS